MRTQDRHCFNFLMKTLEESDLTYAEMVEVSGFSIWYLIRLMRRLSAEGKVHVCGYLKDRLGRESVKIYRFGRGKNAIPNKLTGAEKQRRYKARCKLRAIPMSLLAA